MDGGRCREFLLIKLCILDLNESVRCCFQSEPGVVFFDVRYFVAGRIVYCTGILLGKYTENMWDVCNMSLDI